MEFAKLTIIMLSLALFGCAGNFQYTKSDMRHLPSQTEVIVIYDYLALKDDIGELLDFEESKNQEGIETYGTLMKDMLENHGFSVSEKTLRSSGLGAPPNTVVEHHVDGKKADEPLALPLIWRSDGFSKQEIQAVTELYDELEFRVGSMPSGQFTTPKIAQESFGEYMSGLELSDDTLVLLARITKPRISAGKTLGMVALSAATVGVATGGEYFAYPTYYVNERMAAFLLHKGSGELLWKNFRPKVSGAKTAQEKFFAGFPAAEQASQPATFVE